MPSTEDAIRSNLKNSIDDFLTKKKLEKNENQHNIKFLNILEFVERFKLLPYGLYPVQKFLLKMYYCIPLDTVLPDEVHNRIKVPKDWRNVADCIELTEVEYLQHLYSEGRCNTNTQGTSRRELILVMGRRSGKCSKLSTLISTEFGLMELGQLMDMYGVDRTSSGWTNASFRITQERGKISEANSIYYGGIQNTKKIKSRFGYNMEATGEHRLKVMDESGSISWKHFSDIKLGDYVGVNRSGDIWPENYLNISEIKNKHFLGTQDSLHPVFSTNIIDERFAEFIGVLADSELGWSLFEDSRTFSSFFNDIGYDEQEGKPTEKIPWIILRSPKSVVASYLRGLFHHQIKTDLDSNITLGSYSPSLCHVIQLLFLNFGIICKISNDSEDDLESISIIDGASKKIFYGNIGYITDVERSFPEASTDFSLNDICEVDLVPNLRTKLRFLVESVSDTVDRSVLKGIIGRVTELNSRENPTYELLKLFVSSARKVGANSEICDQLDDIIECNYFWDEIILVEDSQCEVGDLNVPDDHSYVAGGFTNHNSTLSAIISAYELYKLLRRGHPQSYFGMPDGSEIRIMCIANDKEQAQIVYQEMSGYIGQVDYFKNSMIHDTQSYMRFQTDNDKRIFGEAILGRAGGKGTITATFKSSVAKGLRGRGVICCIMDEIAFFEEVGKSSADEIYRAISPALKQFSPKDPQKKIVALGPTEARMILISSPDSKDGFFFRQYQMSKSNAKASSNILMLQAPTWEVNPTLSPQDYEEDYAKNPNAFETEFGAKFSDRVRGWIESSKDLTDCIDLDARPITRGLPKEPFFAGVDFGLVNDGTSITLTHIKGGKIKLAYHEAWYAGVTWKEANPHLTEPATEYANRLQHESRLDIEEIAKWFEALSKRFYMYDGVFDQWAGTIFEQHLHKVGLNQFEMRKFTTLDASNMYQTVKMAMFDQLLSLYDWPHRDSVVTTDGPKVQFSPLITELLELQAQSGGKNIVIVEAPKILGKHDDIADSFARSVLLATEYISKNPGILEASKSYLSSGRKTAMPLNLGGYRRQKARLHGGVPKERRIPRK